MGVGTGTGGGASGTGLPAGGSALTAVARGTWKGEETHVLTIAELAAHTHDFNYGNGSGGNLVAGGGNSVVAQAASPATQGSDTAHNNIQPIMGLSFLIKT